METNFLKLGAIKLWQAILFKIIYKFEVSRYPLFEEWDKITAPIEDMVLDKKNLFFNAEIADKQDRCWMGVIYAAS